MIYWLSLFACSSNTPQEPTSQLVNVVYQSRVDGETEPCGCPKRPLGGLAKRNSIAQTVSEKGPALYLDGGNALSVVLRENLREDVVARKIRFASLIAEGLMDGGLDAMALGPGDWSLGSEVVFQIVKDKHLPIVAANLECSGEAPFAKSLMFERGGKQIAVIGAAVGEVSGCVVGDIAETVSAQAEVARKAGADAVIALIPETDDRTLRASMVKMTGVDITIGSTGRHSRNRPQKFGDSLLYEAGIRGKSVGLLSLTFRSGATQWAGDGHSLALTGKLERAIRGRAEAMQRAQTASKEDRESLKKQVAAYDQTIDQMRETLSKPAEDNIFHLVAGSEIDLGEEIADDVATRTKIDALQATLQEEALGKGAGDSGPLSAPVNSVYAGTDACLSCHIEQAKQWNTTQHAKAWGTLIREQRAAEDACFSCHSTGSHKPGGAEVAAEVKGLRGVQCEACHGPSRAHLANPKEVRVQMPTKATCTQCHDGVNDGGRFNYDTYLPKIRHTP